MLKTTFDIGDPVKFSYELPPPLAPITVQLNATVLEALDNGHFIISVYGGAIASRAITVPPENLTSCVHVSDLEFEARLYAGAKKVSWRDVDCDEMLYDNDRNEYYRLDEFEDNWDDYDADERPSYLWCCKSRVVRLAPADDQIDSLVDSCRFSDEERWSVEDFQEVEQLRLAIDKFNAANVDKVVWSPDYSRAVLLKDFD